MTGPHFKDLILFHEYFDAETGRGLGASHQTGWTGLIVRCLEMLAGKGVIVEVGWVDRSEPHQADS